MNPYDSPEQTYIGSDYSPIYSSPPLPVDMILPQQVDVVVPQRQYSANIQRNHTFSIGPLMFMTSRGKGIRLADLQARVDVGLVHRDLQPLEGFGTKVTYRIEWPGYDSFNKQKHALRATRAKESVSLHKIALHVAEVMKAFIQEAAGQPSSEQAWRVGPGYIEFEDLYLLEVHQVAKASLQPVIAYRPRGLTDSPAVSYPTFYPPPQIHAVSYPANPMLWD